MSSSGLYPAEVIHVRHAPVEHSLRYRALYMLLDLDEVRDLARRNWLFSFNHFNIVSWWERDHGDGSAQPLRQQIDDILRRSGIPTGGPMRVLCMPRIFGLVFNPLTIFFCHGQEGELAAILYEVNNTFGQRHSYLIPVPSDDGGLLDQTCAKEFYVSPFLPMTLTYRFRVREPRERLVVKIGAHDQFGKVLTAVLWGNRQTLSDRRLLEAVLRTPLLAWQVLGAIHWEALKLWRKGLRLRPKPQPPPDRVSVATEAQP